MKRWLACDICAKTHVYYVHLYLSLAMLSRGKIMLRGRYIEEYISL
ncbi:hypothetical protein APHCR_0102 [Anaplasma phagocytophilum str. CR1007]|uniref:Uncharacterized protein n=1 Tax=Anaplasma phagocytophilum str. ApNP TaxID=1359153 RepID=A0A0F3NJN0_ANAPH|nr:hypothetical protein APHWEB_1448 [Anaplasma phagocytophilum str. Webster]KJV67932.1 hypothetical protein APHNP_0002 [Anaplasma phagocytophilum str. ApNP]KJV87641.1 hypothetical protein APHNYW_0593 [Anaplasma phagocytophilum str. ApNYW]KJV98991.1 hypothetical protein OTSANNIE_0844 [Anaplasma phagocytophilum str. Annie]KJZ98135.1 hypothetical protein APHDU1_1390 [Anaplasma phagocytophilum]KJZ98881.1 hypothetical protein APHCR_0102 [Anaplasma phagocytophilum str. CR1007]